MTSTITDYRVADGNAAAELRHDKPYDMDAREKLRARALDDLVDRIMAGEEYPKRGNRLQVNLIDILCESEPFDLASAIQRELLNAWTLAADVERIVRGYLAESKWLDLRADELAEEELDEG